MVTHILNTLVHCKPFRTTGTRLSTHFYCFQLKRKSSPHGDYLVCCSAVTLLQYNEQHPLIETSSRSHVVWPNSFRANWVMSKNNTSWRSITIYKRSRDLPTIIYNLLSFLGKQEEPEQVSRELHVQWQVKPLAKFWEKQSARTREWKCQLPGDVYPTTVSADGAV